MKKVYVLGAGFSAQADLPILSDFFNKVENKKDKTDRYEGKEIEKETFERVLKLKLGKDKDGNSYNMESAFTAICEKFDIIKKLDKSFTDGEQLKKDFLYTVCRTYHLCWTDGGKNSRCLYRRFLERVIKEQAIMITFNYDLILDNLFFDMRLLPYYGFELNAENTINFNSNFPGLKESGVTFLKMHGSQQWFKCNLCEKELTKIDLNDNWPSHRSNKDTSSGEKCITKECIEREKNGGSRFLDYLIVPPLKNKKSPAEELLKAVWEIAECKIREAEEIVFIGYSFPDSDKNIQTRFKNWLKNNIVLNSIKVVDPCAANQDFKGRFNEIFKNKWAPPETHQFSQVPKCNLTYIPKTFLCWLLEDFNQWGHNQWGQTRLIENEQA